MAIPVVVLLLTLLFSPIWISFSLFPWEMRLDFLFFGISFEKSDKIQVENKSKKKKNAPKNRIKNALHFLCRNSTLSLRNDVVTKLTDECVGAEIGILYALFGCLLTVPKLYFKDVDFKVISPTVARIKTRVIFVLLSLIMLTVGDKKNVGQPNE